MKTLLFKALYPLYLLWWVNWSRLYRFLYHRSYRGVAIPRGSITPAEAMSKLAKLRWKKDGKKELGDAIASPHWVQYLINKNEFGSPVRNGALDSEDYALWACNAISTLSCPVVLSVLSLRDGRPRSHSVCVFRDHANSTFRYLDNFGVQGSFSNFKEIVADILAVFNNDVMVGWALLNKNASIVSFGVRKGSSGDLI